MTRPAYPAISAECVTSTMVIASVRLRSWNIDRISSLVCESRVPDQAAREVIERAGFGPYRVHLTGYGLAPGFTPMWLEPVHLDLSAGEPHFLVFGDSGSGKSSFLRTWLAGMVERNSAWDARFMIVDYRRSLLEAVPEPYIGAYAGDPGSAQEYADQLAAKLAERMPPPGISARELRERSWWSGPHLYLVVDDYDLVGGGRTSPLAGLADFVAHAPEIGFHVVIARRVTGASRTLMSDPLLSRIRELGADGMLLSGDPREGALLGEERAAALVPGRGLLVRRQHPSSFVQVGLLEPVP